MLPVLFSRVSFSYEQKIMGSNKNVIVKFPYNLSPVFKVMGISILKFPYSVLIMMQVALWEQFAFYVDMVSFSYAIAMELDQDRKD